MKKVEIISGASIVISMLLHFFSAPGFSLFLWPGILLAFMYLLLGFAIFNDIGFSAMFKNESYTGIGVPRIIVGILAGITMFCLVMAVLFNYIHWPGRGLVAVTSSVLGFLLLLFSGLKAGKGNSQLFRNIVLRVAVLLSMLYIFFLPPLELYFRLHYYYAAR